MNWQVGSINELIDLYRNCIILAKVFHNHNQPAMADYDRHCWFREIVVNPICCGPITF